MDKQQQLLEIKRKILDNLIELVVSQSGEASERAETVLSIIELGNSSIDLYSSALGIINSVENATLKTDFLMRLLANVQESLSDETPAEIGASEPAQSTYSEAVRDDEQQG